MLFVNFRSSTHSITTFATSTPLPKQRFEFPSPDTRICNLSISLQPMISYRILSSQCKESGTSVPKLSFMTLANKNVCVIIIMLVYTVKILSGGSAKYDLILPKFGVRVAPNNGALELSERMEFVIEVKICVV